MGALAQPYVAKKTQHRFAQSYLGLNIQTIPSSGKLFWNGSSGKFPSMYSPRLNIGGLHFWGMVDFNMNFPLVTLGDFAMDDDNELVFTPGGDLSARFYPWRMKYKKLRPYIGYSANEMKLTIKNEQIGKRNDLFITSSGIAGISYANNRWQFSAEIMHMFDNTRTFYSNRQNEHEYVLPKSYFSFGFVKFFEGTLQAEENKNSGLTDRIERKLRKEATLNSFSFSFAPSGAYFLKAPSFSDAQRLSLPRHKASMVWEYGAGYLFHDAKLHVGISYRDYTSVSESYDFEHLIRRYTFALEARKFFWNYNGFVPFVGPSISFERWAVGQFEGDTQVGETQRTRMISPGIVFGWDILASPIETWVLRTNLRYYPFQRINGTDGSKIDVDQFEFNFIQLVVYPNRLFNVRRVKRGLE